MRIRSDEFYGNYFGLVEQFDGFYEDIDEY